ncbi:Hypothetical Protein FCC1311_103832 [Hondaea fermentalgiana]|uniref:Uncharacterized protein n=1 Tax=Hondaea fermentalgiana TaxID=2315210 RepID=A0A2R5GV13_9STRA|nr:Hypothetical Protein FCC1311_103832 [Hondaea fermentalgiana]|eukprot:GBG34159.1 Hypothetical Protein FCC1311_103832 [Hondaea fermentalgiana]
MPAVRGLVERLLDEKALLRQEIERLQEEQSRQHHEVIQVRGLLQDRNRLVLDLQQEKDVLQARVRRLEAEALPFVTQKDSGYPYDLRELYATLVQEKEGFKRREARLRHKLKGERAENKLLRHALQTDVTFSQEEAEVELAKARDRIRILENERNEAAQRAMKASFVNALQKNEIDILKDQISGGRNKAKMPADAIPNHRPAALAFCSAASPASPEAMSTLLLCPGTPTDTFHQDSMSPQAQGGARALRDELSLAKNRLEHRKHQITRLERRMERQAQRLQHAEAAKNQLEADLAQSKLQAASEPGSLVNVLLAKANRFAFAEVERFRKIGLKLVDQRNSLLNRIEALELAKDRVAALAEEKLAGQVTENKGLLRTIRAHERGALATKSHLVLTQASIQESDGDHELFYEEQKLG